jgi:transposase
MTVRLTAQQEAFVLGILDGKTQSDAYRDAYPSSRRWQPDTVWRRASELMRHREVSGRIDELRAKVAERHEVTQDTLVDMAMAAYRLAQRNGEAAAMNQSVAVLARITGHDKPKGPDRRREIPIQYLVPAGADEAIEGEYEEVGDGDTQD